jgi:hypothetical protein
VMVMDPNQVRLQANFLHRLSDKKVRRLYYLTFYSL